MFVWVWGDVLVCLLFCFSQYLNMLSTTEGYPQLLFGFLFP